MENHSHLFVRTPYANITEGIHYIAVMMMKGNIELELV